MSKRWIPSDLKEGSLHHQLGIPGKEKIPISTLTQITGTKIGNTTKIGKKKVKVTSQLYHRARFALTMKRL